MIVRETTTFVDKIRTPSPDTRIMIQPAALENTEKNACLEVCAAPGAAGGPDLLFVVNRWQRLPERVRTGIAAMVRATGG